MNRLLCVCSFVVVSLGVSPVEAAPGAKGFHPIKAVRAVWQRERALRRLEKIVRAKPRLAVKFQERFGKLGGRKQFAAKGPLVMLGIGTTVNVGGFIQSDMLIPYLVAGAVVDLSAFATHLLGVRRLARKATISMIEDRTISETDLKPFRKALGLGARGRRLTPKPAPKKEPPAR